MTRLILAAGAALVLSSCEVGPDYHVPEQAKINDPAAQSDFMGTHAKQSASEAVPSAWWRLFDDPRLDKLEQEALDANTDLRIAAANLARAEAVLREVKGEHELRGGAAFGAERAQLSGESFLLPVQLPTQYLGDGEVRISYQLDLFGRLERAAEAADADREASRAGLDLARISVAAEVARAFVETCAAGREFETVQRAVGLQERTRDVIHRLAEAGRESTIAFTQATNRVEQLRSTLPLQRARRRAALYRLAALTGHAPAAFSKELETCTDLPQIARPLPVGDGAALLKRRPDIRQAERALAAATARIGVATAALYPDITLGAEAGSIGLLSDLGKPAAETWSIGSVISWTFPTSGEQARVEEASAAAAAALAKFDGVVLNALRETETSLTIYGQDLDRSAALRAARDRAAETAQQTDALVKAGRSPVLNGLTTQQSLAAADEALVAADSQVSLDQVNLFLALGGGWQ